MPSQTLTLNRQDLQEVLDAIAVIERLYPGHEIKLVPIGGTNGSPQKTEKRGKQSFRELVEDACFHKPLSLAGLVSATGLTKNQIRGVFNAPSQKEHYKRTEQSDGSKLYQYVGPERE